MGGFNTAVVLTVTDDGLKAFITIRDEKAVDEQILKQLIADKKITYGLVHEVLSDINNNPRPGTFVIARGKPPVQGKDGFMQYLFDARSARSNKTGDNIDFREIFNVPSVLSRTVLAVYHPAVPGQDGISVTGVRIPANPVNELTVRAGKGAVLGPDGLSVISDQNGRPWVKKRGRYVTVGVESVYQHEGDVDIKSGNLRFNGDVIITGNVTENMIVDINGNLRVLGFVSRATIKVKGNLEVMKVITASQINAGGTMAALSKMENSLVGINEDIVALNGKALLLMKNLKERRQNVQFGQVVMTLLDRQYSGMDKKVRAFIDLINHYDNINPPAELKDAARKLKALTGLQALSLTGLDGIIQSLDAAISVLHSMNNEQSHIVANGIWNSVVDATGNIKITGQGLFNSRVTALGTVEVNGVFRGGEVFARGGIRAGEIGGQMGIKTTAKTVEGCIIRARRVYNGSVLQIGTRIYNIRQDENMVVARLNEHGDIVLH